MKIYFFENIFKNISFIEKIDLKEISSKDFSQRQEISK